MCTSSVTEMDLISHFRKWNGGIRMLQGALQLLEDHNAELTTKSSLVERKQFEVQYLIEFCTSFKEYSCINLVLIHGI